jgi:hypothetical protein
MAMEHATYPRNIYELENHLDRALSNLRIYRLPVELALIVSLTVFEEQFRTTYERIPDRFSAEAAMLSHKAALQILIPQILRRCSQPAIENKVIEVTLDALADVGNALEFCQRYDIATLAYTQLHQGWFVGSLNGRIAEFDFAEGTDFGRAQLNFTLHGYHERQTLFKSVGSGKLPPSIPVEKFKEAMLEAIRCADIKEILYLVPDDIYVPFREIAEGTIGKPTVDATAHCHNYTVDEYHRFWIELATLMAIYSVACEGKHKIDKSFNLLENRVLQFSLPRLAALVTNRGNVEYESAKCILPDIVLDLKASRPDVLVQPLVPLPNRQIVLVSPSLIITSNWEVCLLRNWSRYPDVYGDVVASKKDKLADQFSELFDPRKFKISTRKKLRNEKGELVGDVDVALFDPSDGLLVLIEIKWLIEPDSPRETVRSNEELSRGIRQLLKVRFEFERDASNFLRQVFPNHNIEVGTIRDVQCFVIGYGDVGIKDDEQNGVFTLDYFLSCELIARSGDSSLRRIMANILNKQRQLSDSAAKMAGTMKVKLAGFLFCLPGHGTYIHNIPSGAGRREIGRNDPCLCGSGLKYKKCCLELADYDEHII